MDLVTVIIPVYNTETYLKQCIDSIIDQTYRPIQLILVDDGSKDQSLSICQEYAKNHSWIEVYHQENQGVSVARNTGLQYTKGKWVFFIDSDDYVTPTYIEHFMELGDHPFIGGGYTENTKEQWRYHVEHCVLSLEEYIAHPRQNINRIPSVHVIGNRYLYSVITEHSLSFDRGITCGEDLRFNVKYFACVDTLCASPHCDYQYTLRENSATHTFWPNRLEEERTESQVREALFAKSEEFNFVKYIHWHTALEHFYNFSAKVHPEHKVASKQLRKAVADRYFRKSIPWIIKNGSKDMKIEAICVWLGSYRLYKFCLKMIGNLHKALRK